MNIVRRVMLRFAWTQNPTQLKGELAKLKTCLDRLSKDPSNAYKELAQAVEVIRDFFEFLGSYAEIGDWPDIRDHQLKNLGIVGKQSLDPNRTMQEGGKDVFRKAEREVSVLEETYEEALVMYLFEMGKKRG